MEYDDMLDNKHYQLRGSFTEWPAVENSPYVGQNIRGPAFPLRFKNNPTQIWRGGPTIGMDNETILNELGYSNEEIDALYESRVLRKGKKPTRTFKIVD
jgi:L-carnitine CoA-transferase